MAISNGMKRGCTIKENEIHIRSFSTKEVEKMLARERMSHPVITIHPDMLLFDTLGLMRTEGIRLLHVVDKRGKLVGIVTERDLLHAGPLSASTFSEKENK
jgi:CBS domain-containing protein